MILNPVIYSGKKLPELDNPGSAADLLEGKQLVDQYGELLTGTMPRKSVNDLTVSGETVTVPAGYYPGQVSKSVAAAAQAVPSITVSSGGLITASAAQTEGYVAAGTKSATKQLTAQAATTITPGTSAKTAVAAGRYTTGAVKVAGSSNLTAGNIKAGVNIFGVTGTVNEAILQTITFENKSSRSVTIHGTFLDSGTIKYKSITLAAGAKGTYQTVLHSILAILYYYLAGYSSNNLSFLTSISDTSNRLTLFEVNTNIYQPSIIFNN